MMKSRLKRYFPIFEWAGNYKKEYLSGDISAGITVGIMLIPQGMAYAMIAGLPPVYGLYASIVPQLIYALLGTSRQLSVAPVAMDSLLVAAGVSVLATEGTEAYIAYAILLSFFMGLFQWGLGMLRMGFITNLLAKPVISGFTSAAALIIGLNQLKYLFGISVVKSSNVFEILFSTFQNLEHTHLLTLGIGILGIVVIKVSKRIHAKIPAALVAVIVGSVLVYFFSMEESGVSIVGVIPEGLPSFTLPQFSLGQLGEVIPLALTISVVAFMESFSVSKAIEAKKKDHKVNANQELIALGASNVFGSFFQSYPVTGGFSRSAVNYQGGANTPFASVVSATLVGLTLLFLTPLFYFLPKAILASVIMVAISSLIDIVYAKNLWKTNKVEFALLAATFLITLNFSMVPGIVSGIALSILILLYRQAYPHIAELGRVKELKEFRNIKRFEDLEKWADLLILRVDAPLTFVNIQYVKDYIVNELAKKASIQSVLLDAGPVSHIDASALIGLNELIDVLKEQEVKLILTEVVGPVRDILNKNHLVEKIGKENFFLDLDQAVQYLKENHHRKDHSAIVLQAQK